MGESKQVSNGSGYGKVESSCNADKGSIKLKEFLDDLRNC
jgi:hypothetical protein